MSTYRSHSYRKDWHSILSVTIRLFGDQTINGSQITRVLPEKKGMGDRGKERHVQTGSEKGGGSTLIDRNDIISNLNVTVDKYFYCTRV